MTDFNDLKTSTDYAIRGFYRYIYSFIPKEFRLDYTMDEGVDTYGAFFDQELTYENRLKYKASKIKYPDRKSPWLALMWNKEGLQPADNHYRQYDVRLNLEGNPVKGKACYVKLPMNIGVVSNTLTALDEFQEVFLLNVRPDDAALAVPHPIIEDFTVNLMDMNISSSIKLPRQEGTLCMSMLSVMLQYPVVGCIDTTTGVINTINTYIRNYNENLITDFHIHGLQNLD